MIRVLAALLLVGPLAGLAGPAAAQADDWSDPRPFRLTIELGDAHDPIEGRDVTLVTSQLVLVPVDITAALRAAGTWPTDAAGAPLAWSFAPDTLRVAPRGSDETLPARFLPYSLDAEALDYDAASNAAGLLAVELPAGTRALEAYFDVQGRAATAAAPDARLDEVAGLGPWVATLAHVPPTPAGATPSLVVLSDEGTARVRVLRIDAGAPPALLTEAEIHLVRSLPLPPTEQGYDILVTADMPILALLRTSDAAEGAFHHASLDGTASGQSFLLATPGIAQLVGTRSGTSVTVTDAASGAPLGSFTLGRLATRDLDVAADKPLRVRASAPILALQAASAREGVDRFLATARGLAGEASATLAVAPRAAGHAALASAPTTAQAFPLASPQSATSAKLGEPTALAWIARSSPPERSEPWAFSAAAPIAVLTGSDGYSPIGGTEGREFALVVTSSRDADRPAERSLAARLLAPFGATRVDVETTSLGGARLQTGSIDLGPRGALTTIPGADADLATEGTILRASATKPVFLALFRPGAPAVAPLPGLPPLVTPSRVALDHSGAILSWTPLATFQTARPGETTRIELTLANFGRTKTREGVVESASLEASIVKTARCTANWETALPEPRVDGLASPGQRAVELLVVVPETARPGDCAEIELRARSSYDTSVVATARVNLRARSAFEPELRVVAPSGERAQAASFAIEAGQRTLVEMRLRNLGGEAGVAILRHAPAPGYESALLPTPDAGAAERYPLAAGAETSVWLSLRAPTGAEPPWDFVVQATSAADPNARDEVVLRVKPRAELSLRATTDAPRIEIAPGTNSTLSVRVENLGADVDVRARIGTTLPPGWTANVTPERALLRAAGARADLGERLDATNLTLHVRAPSDARVGTTLPLAIAFEGSGSGSRIPLLVVVKNDLRIDAKMPGPILAGPRDEGVATIEIVSRAPGPMDLEVRSITAPKGWNVTVREPVGRLAPGEASTLLLRYAVASRAPAGPGALHLVLELKDPAGAKSLVERNFSTVTRALALVEIVPSATRIIIADGERAPVLFDIRNEGNAPATLDPEVGGPLALATDLPTTLAAGARFSASALVGPDSGAAKLTIGGATATIDVAPARRDVRIVRAEPRMANGARFVDIEIENAGTLASGPLTLRAIANDREVAASELAPLPPGGRARHTIIAPAAAIALRVELVGPDLDAAAQYTSWRIPATADDTEESAVVAARRAVPAPAVIALLALACLAPFVGRRSG